MKKNLCNAIKLVGLLAIFSSHAAPKLPEVSIQIQTWQTNQGVPVYFVERHQLPIVDVAALFSAGSAYDGATPGVAALTNSLLSQGTKTKSSDEVATLFDQIGMKFFSNCSRDMAWVGMRSLSDQPLLSQASGLINEILTQPILDQRSFDRVKNQTIQSIRQGNEDPMQVAIDQMFKLLYGNYPYAHRSMGTLPSVKMLTRDQILEFYRGFYVAANMKIVIVGDLTVSAAHQLANQLTQQMPMGQKSPTFKAPIFQKGDSDRWIRFPASQNALVLGQLAIDYQSPFYFPLMVGNQVLGGAPFLSLLFNKVRNDKGLTYSISSDFMPLKYPGPFLIVLQTRAQKTPEALTTVRQVVKAFLEAGPSSKQLSIARSSMLGGYPLTLVSNQDMLSALAEVAFYNLPLNYLNEYPKKIAAVTAGQVKSAFDQVISMQNMKTVIVGPAKDPKPQSKSTAP